MKRLTHCSGLNWVGVDIKKGTQGLLGILLFYSFAAKAQPVASQAADATGNNQQFISSRNSLSAPPDTYLDFPFLPQDTGVNKFLQSMDDHGVKPFVKYWGDFLANPVGGISQTEGWAQLLIFGGKFDLERLVGWRGAQLTVSAADYEGKDISQSVGTYFTPSQAVVAPHFQLFLVYLSQKFDDDKVEIRVGHMTAVSMFSTLPAMALPVSGAINGNPISLSYDIAGYHGTGKATWAAAIKVKPTSDTYVQTGIFQVNAHRENQNYFNGLDFSIRRGDGVLLMAEAGWSPTFCEEKAPDMGKEPFHRQSEFAGLPGLYEFGTYLENYPMSTFVGDNTIQNEYGFYLQGQQMLWRSRTNPDHNFSLWAGVTYSPQAQIASMPLMGYGGLIWSGLIPGRDKDQLLLDTYIGEYSEFFSQKNLTAGMGPNTVETVFEASYIIQLTKQIQFQPDLQWFIQPGGRRSIPNALVIGCQISFLF